MKLTPKQEKFCEFYVALGNATEAAKKAGHSEKTAKSVGSENLTKPDLRNRIGELTVQEQEKRIAKAEEVLAFFTAAMRDGNVQMKDRLRAAENLAKRMGLDREDRSFDSDEGETKIVIQPEDASVEGDNEIY